MQYILHGIGMRINKCEHRWNDFELRAAQRTIVAVKCANKTRSFIQSNYSHFLFFSVYIFYIFGKSSAGFRRCSPHTTTQTIEQFQRFSNKSCIGNALIIIFRPRPRLLLCLHAFHLSRCISHETLSPINFFHSIFAILWRILSEMSMANVSLLTQHVIGRGKKKFKLILTRRIIHLGRSGTYICVGDIQCWERPQDPNAKILIIFWIV